MKFGKQIQKKQLEIPEYAASFVDYKALKKLIKELKNSPLTRPGSSAAGGPGLAQDDPQSALQANRETFFFRLDRELDKVNDFYTLKEKESRVRLRVLIDKQRSMRLRNPIISRNSNIYSTLEQGFRDFIRDLSKLQQFIEINATAFSKILKKWDKTSKSQTKELYLSRAVEVQPCFNRDVISELSDQANTSLLDCSAWAEGESTVYEHARHEDQVLPTPRLEQDETDSDLLDALNKGDITASKSLISHVQTSVNAGDRLTRAFLSAVAQAPEEVLKLMLETNLIDLHRRDEINDRNCLHKVAMTGRRYFLCAGLAAQVDSTQVDAYGRIPLHYACMNGHVDIIADLIEAAHASKESADLDNTTPLLHAIAHSHYECVAKLLSFSVRIDPVDSTDQSPLNLACQHGFLPVVELLLAGSPKILPDAEGLYPQHLVARFGRDPRILILLRDYGANLDQPDKLYQWTPLFHAASEGRVECLKKLLECGVDAAAKDEKDLPAQYYATWEGHLECMALLAAALVRTPLTGSSQIRPPQKQAIPAQLTSPGDAFPRAGETDIPALVLPPPIIPTRRYGHNFLESKTTVILNFDDEDHKPVAFYDESKYPAARLTVAPRSSDMLPRNILLPIQEENRSISFEIDNLENFAVDFDVFPTFGKKVVAKGSAPSEVFRASSSSSGKHYLSLLDPRLRSVGQIRFSFQVIKPFNGTPLNITPFATYWKATSQFDSRPSSLVTGSSLSGDHVRVYVQLSRDGIPVIYPRWTLQHGGLDFPVQGLDFSQFIQVGGALNQGSDQTARLTNAVQTKNLAIIHTELARSYLSLEQVLQWFPIDIHMEMHILYPNPEEEEAYRLGPTMNLNNFVDALLKVVFQHARNSRKQSGSSMMRSMVFSSYNKDLCMALNWKQPNFPVLLCNDLGADSSPGLNGGMVGKSSGRTVMSIKESVRLAQSNNLMGLICRSQLLDMVPALVESIKVAGLVLVSDASTKVSSSASSTAHVGETRGVGVGVGVGLGGGGMVPSSLVAAPSPPFLAATGGSSEGIDGVLRANGVLRFSESVDI